MPRELNAGGRNMDAKHASLMQDYLQLQDEFDALKDGVDAAKTRKATVLAEVRFLRRRLKKLKKSPSNLKERETLSLTVLSPSANVHSGKYTSSAVVPDHSSQSRINISVGTSAIPVFWEPLRATEQKSLNDNVELASVLKTSDLKSRPNGFVRALAGKRKISWQDQISLECN